MMSRNPFVLIVILVFCGCSEQSGQETSNNKSGTPPPKMPSALAPIDIFQYPNMVSRRDEIVKAGKEIEVKATVDKIIVIPTKSSLFTQDDTVVLTVKESKGRFHAGDVIRIKFDQFAMSPKVYSEGEVITLGITDDILRPQLTAYRIKK